MTALTDGLKNLVKRVPFWIVAIVGFILVDEYIKEGYLFKIEDLLSGQITHEKLILFTVLIGLNAWLWIKNKNEINSTI